MAVDTFSKLVSKLSTMNSTEVATELKKYDLAHITPELVKMAISDSSTEIRLNAIKGLRWIADPSAIGGLKKALLHDDNNKVRIAIIEFIGSLREASMIPTLTKLVNRDDDPDVIKACSLAIQVIQGVTPEGSMDS